MYLSKEILIGLFDIKNLQSIETELFWKCLQYFFRHFSAKNVYLYDLSN